MNQLDLFSNYTNRIKDVISQRKLTKSMNEGIGGITNLYSQMRSKKELINEQIAFSSKMQLNAQPLNQILNPEALEHAELGLHPDFKHLKNTNDTEEHYIVSVFIDIVGSTNLFKEYTKEEIYQITNTIQSAALHTCLAFGGHVQRLQGDGVFAYFGGKSISKTKAVETAVTACSMITYFVKNDLTNIFLEDGVEDIKTRIGIDFGDDDEVLWANFGLYNISELTTLSLHTSLASKMQGYASVNGIVVGQYVKDKLGIDESHFDYVKDSEGKIIKRYIFEIPKKNFRYTQYRFDWYKYLKGLPFIESDKSGKLFFVDPEEKEKNRIDRLQNTASAILKGEAYLDNSGKINTHKIGVHHEPHRFHYGK